MTVDAEIDAVAAAAFHRIGTCLHRVEEAETALVYTRVDRVAARVAIRTFLRPMAILAAAGIDVCRNGVGPLPVGMVVFGEKWPQIGVASSAPAGCISQAVLAR